MKRLALFLSLLVSAVLAAPALALPGDPGVASRHFRLNTQTLEPGCYAPGQLPVSIDLSYLDQGVIAPELQITVLPSSPVNVDQVWRLPRLGC